MQRDSTGQIKGPKAKNQVPGSHKSGTGESLVVIKGNDSKKGLKSKSLGFKSKFQKNFKTISEKKWKNIKHKREFIARFLF